MQRSATQRNVAQPTQRNREEGRKRRARRTKPRRTGRRGAGGAGGAAVRKRDVQEICEEQPRPAQHRFSGREESARPNGSGGWQDADEMA